DSVAAGDQHTGTASGNEDTAIALDIATSLSEVDADAIISVTITGVPTGASLSAGLDNGGGSWTLTPAELSGLTLTSDGEVENFALSVTATTTDGANPLTADTASTSGTINVTVTPVADAPHLDLDSVAAGDQHTGTASGNEDTAIALDIATSLSEVDADAIISVTSTGVPPGASLSAGLDNGGGSWTLTPAELSGLTLTSDGEVENFALSVTAT